jgi:hypothetical protein
MITKLGRGGSRQILSTGWCHKMAIGYELTGFDPHTDELVTTFPIRADRVHNAKKAAGLPHPFKDFADEQPLTGYQAHTIADIIGVKFDPRLVYTLSPFSEGDELHELRA